MKTLLLNTLHMMITSMLDSDIINDLKDRGIKIYQLATDEQIDKLEDYIEETENKFDDALLPVIAILRKALNVPDNDSPENDS